MRYSYPCTMYRTVSTRMRACTVLEINVYRVVWSEAKYVQYTSINILISFLGRPKCGMVGLALCATLIGVHTILFS